MKKVLFLLVALAYGQFSYAQWSDLAVRRLGPLGVSYSMHGYDNSDCSEKEKDEAYSAPNSKLCKTWYVVKGYAESRRIPYYNFKANGTFTFSMGDMPFIHFSTPDYIITRKGTWKRSHDKLVLTTNPALTTVSPNVSKEELKNVSPRIKAKALEIQAKERKAKKDVEKRKIIKLDDYRMILEDDSPNGYSDVVLISEAGLEDLEEKDR